MLPILPKVNGISEIVLVSLTSALATFMSYLCTRADPATNFRSPQRSRDLQRGNDHARFASFDC